MYKEVAFNPCCLGSFEYYSLIRQQFGFAKGRYVAADRRTWAQEAMCVVKQAGLATIREQSIKNYLNKLARSRGGDEFFLAPDRPNASQQPWKTWLEGQTQVRPFDVVVSEEADNGCLNVDSIINGDQAWEVPVSLSVVRTPQAIIHAMCGLLRLSKEVTLIDPYFRLAGNRTLSELFLVVERMCVRHIRVVSTINTNNPQQVYEREYRAANNKGITLEWVIAPDHYFHDRYLLTDVGAIRSGHGFMEDVVKGGHADQVNLNLICSDEAQRTHEALKSLLDGGAVRFQLA
ncbi:hypothetical protein GIV47_01605 [Pseudomonas marginalis]|uniref:hypothetical protein n=1 Tax=Pseudomonas marginalis TaxID=298 RepID=UPI001F336166|nr:hypothetical protein [Pseudomonas marginalis]MCF5663651.1 hypothetical protein [Pseudomonas marginalis]